MTRYALVIGITQYDYQYNFPNLTKPAKDAEAVARLLEERGGFHKVTRLPKSWNSQRGCLEVAADRLTSEELVQALQTFLEEAGRGDALIYFSGHGFVVADKLNQRQNRKKGYLVTSDSQIETIAAHGIPFDSLNNLIRDSNLSSLVLLLDCCHAGSYLERDLVEQTLTAFGSQKDYYLIAACRASEKAYEGLPEQENSVFTEALLEGLAQERADRDGQISCDRLFDHIYKSKKLRNFGQQPIRWGLGDSITLVTYPIENKQPVTLNRQNPYQGLRAFDLEQAQYFYGREEAIRALLSRLTQNCFLSVIGPSGSGKSSLVKAGLLPRLKSDRLPGSSQWDIESFTPGKHPLTPLQEILIRQHRRNQPYVLFIDQFEEIFTLCENEEEQRTFMQLITAEATNAQRLARVILAMRGDFLDRCAVYPEPATLININEPSTYIVPPLSLQELEEAIKKPAELHGVTFEQGLVSHILEEVEGQPGALPLLQYALSQLWRVCVEDSSSEQPQLTKKGYEQIGGVKGALNETANNLYQNRLPEDRDFIRDLFMQMVQVEEDTVTRRPISWERLDAIANSPEQAQRVVGLLADQRLLVTDDKNVQVVHEALLSEWVLLRKWIEDNREDIRLSRRLEVYCREWQESFNQAENALLPDAWLAPIEDWVKRAQHKLKLTSLEAEYLHRSIEKRDREAQAKLEQERKLREAAEARAMAEAERAQEADARAMAQTAKVKAEKQRTQVAIGAGVVGVVLIASLGLLRVQAKNKELRTVKIGEINTLISSSETFLKTDNQLEALLEGAKALEKLREIDGKKNKKYKASAINRIKMVVAEVRERNRLEGHTRSVNDVSFSPQGELIASGSSDTTVRLWKPDGTLLNTPKPMKHDDEVWSVNFSPSGDVIASSSKDKTVKLWKKDGTLIATLIGHEKDVNAVRFSPDGNTIASASSDNTIRLWKVNVSSSPKILREQPQILREHTERIWDVCFSPNGQLIASASDDGKIKIWKSDGTLLTSFEAHTDIVRSVYFGSDNRTLISVSADRTIRLWEWANDPRHWKVKVITNNANRAFIVRFNPDNKFIAATSADGTIQLWKANNGTPLTTLRRHQDQVYDLDFSSDGKVIVSASRDKTIRLWSLGYDQQGILKINNSDLLLSRICGLISDYLKTNYKVRVNHQDVINVCENSLE